MEGEESRSRVGDSHFVIHRTRSPLVSSDTGGETTLLFDILIHLFARFNKPSSKSVQETLPSRPFPLTHTQTLQSSSQLVPVDANNEHFLTSSEDLEQILPNTSSHGARHHNQEHLPSSSFSLLALSISSSTTLTEPCKTSWLQKVDPANPGQQELKDEKSPRHCPIADWSSMFSVLPNLLQQCLCCAYQSFTPLASLLHFTVSSCGRCSHWSWF